MSDEEPTAVAGDEDEDEDEDEAEDDDVKDKQQSITSRGIDT